jgi:hypothetical protein
VEQGARWKETSILILAIGLVIGTAAVGTYLLCARISGVPNAARWLGLFHTTERGIALAGFTFLAGAKISRPLLSAAVLLDCLWLALTLRLHFLGPDGAIEGCQLAAYLAAMAFTVGGLKGWERARKQGAR